MGNYQSSEDAQEPVVPLTEEDEQSAAASLIQKKWKTVQTDFQWHDNLYDELMEMSETGSLIFYVSHLLKAARSSKEGIKGLDLALPTKPTAAASESAPTAAPQSKTTKLVLAQIISIMESNREQLEKNPDFNVKVDDAISVMKRIGERTSTRKVSLVGLDAEQLKKQDPFFYLAKDDKLKRITLGFSAFCFDSIKNCEKEWVGKPNQKMSKFTLDRALRAKKSGDRVAEVSIHQGFHNYLFAKTKVGGDVCRFDEIVNAVTTIMKDYPKHRIFVTGHGMTAAIGQLTAFALTFKSQNNDIPLPISSVGFSTPRIGDARYWRACELLEIAGKLRTCRVTASSDSMQLYPSAKEYVHAGHEILLEDKNPPRALYSNVQDDGAARLKGFGKKPKTYKEPKDYHALMESNKAKLTEMHLNKLYEEKGVSSFRLNKASSMSQKQLVGANEDNVEVAEQAPPETKQ